MKTLSRCRNNIDADNVVLIDLDTYNFNNVIVIDIPETHTKKQGGSNDKNRPVKTYIYIDDDDDEDDESPCNNDAGANLASERNCENGASSSRRYGSEKTTPVKLSKGKRTYSGRGSNKQSDNESDDDDDDGPDCECMEDFPGKLKEQWEKASLKRKGVMHNDHASSSMPYADARNIQDSNIMGKGHEGKGESLSCDADVDGCKDELPVGAKPSTSAEENEKNGFETTIDDENEKNDFENAATIDDHNDDVPVENSIIGQREKLKETDEYKQALEQELLARQKALQIQAEEAQQLRRLQKRKKAECLRLLDMERRQKQRVEEIREIQKKDEENMNLKEQYRAEVKEKLKRLEITCLDMASLLRGLGIQVGSGPVPLSHEVRAAYKRALLSFHPDRASGSDMRQQVEAEEKFKIICRMKEKFSL